MSYDHWKTGGDNPGITDAMQEDEARERYEESQADLCSDCYADDAGADGLCAACRNARDNYSGPWEVTSGDTSREQYDRAWDQKRALR